MEEVIIKFLDIATIKFIGTPELIELVKEVNMKYIEIRKINDMYVWEYSEEQIKKIKEELKKMR